MIGRISAIVLRELNEIRHSRLVITTLIVPSLLYIVVPVWIRRSGLANNLLGELGAAGDRELRSLQQTLPYLQGMSAAETLQAFIVDQVLVLSCWRRSSSR